MTFWKIDPAHSEISFKVKHLVVSTVTGHFSRFDATIESSTDDFSDARFHSKPRSTASIPRTSSATRI